MFRIFGILMIALASMNFAGCGEPDGNDFPFDDIKINALAPDRQPRKSVETSESGEPTYVFKMPKGSDTALQTTVNLTIHIFETPAENAAEIFSAAEALGTHHIRFNCPDAFTENGFVAAFGRGRMWDSIGRALRESDSKKLKTITLLLQHGYSENIPIAILRNPQSVFHLSCQSRLEGAELDIGRIVMEIKASEIPGQRGIARIEIQPTWVSLIKAKLAEIGYDNDFVFLSTGFSTQMAPADFVYLAPKKFRDERASLSALFFSRGGETPVIRTYLITCREVSE